ncbi:DUF6658 family protein [Microcoleus sp. bin38.metabat.b11b12b14.051]|uniref:DUF6658 family protein n=1 Tax=Microcoleus sp. bin38.metabat.b11b12b14.051 TaxID=2742709 RepID=UPI0025EFA7F5|nr:DUF6658 family protein [Microcoleus sp. bin38.metabat.b11b12b14.051]
MNRLTAFLKKIRAVQILTVFLAGILVFVSTACNRADVASAKTADKIRQEVPSGAVTSEYKGGQNQYADTDPRDKNAAAAEAKAQFLKEQAQQRIETKSSSNVGENVRRVADDAPEKLDQIGEKLNDDARTAQRKADEFGDKTKQGFSNLKENTREGLKGAKEIVKEATEGAKERVAEGTESLKYNTAQGQENVKNAARKVKYSAEDASDKVRAKVNRDIDKTQRAAERAADAID